MAKEIAANAPCGGRRVLIYHAPVSDIYESLPDDTDLRSYKFYRAVLERAIERGVLDVETDGVDVAVYALEVE